MYLNCHSVFSFRYGTMKAIELLDKAKELDFSTLALTDINNTSAALNFVREANLREMKPILGIDFRNGTEQCFIGIAKNNQGFQELNSYLSHFLHHRKTIPKRADNFKNCFIIYPFQQYRSHFIPLKEEEFLGLSLADFKQLPFSTWSNHLDKLVLLQPVTIYSKRSYNIHRLLRAIDQNTLLSKLDAKECCSIYDHFYNKEQIGQALEAYPQIEENTNFLLEECTIDFAFKGNQKSAAINQNKKHYTQSKEEDGALLQQLCEENLSYRYPDEGQHPKVRERLQKELELIQGQGFESYFLINWDMLRFAREQGFFYVGRGSGANSIVAYLLRITDVDPVKLDLYFERFINPYRENPPDFDIDFSWKDRDTITDYLFEKYGPQGQIALMATYNTFTHRSLYRELGKVFGLPKAEIDALAMDRVIERRPDEYLALIYKYANYMEGIPSHLSVHAGGVIISEKPIHYFSATTIPPKGYPLVHFDMVHAEDAGLYKYDILSQRGLGKIKDALDLALQSKRLEAIDIHQINQFTQDPKINDLLKEGKAMGCFYIESPAMRMLLKKLKVDNYLGLVAASSIIRPGVAKSGMMRQYILRSQSESDAWKADTPEIMRELMAETYGVMVYQEDVIKVAHYFAGLSLGEADMLRRGMSGKFRSRAEFAKVKQKFFDNCKEKGYADELTAEVWRQTESFAGYAFSKGHSASYAVESYQSLYLKAYHPMQFILGVLNNGGGFYSTEMYFHEARMMGAQLEAPCVNYSNNLSVLVGEKTIYMGFYLVRDLEQKTALALVKERKVGGDYKSLSDFIHRLPISVEQLRLLIRAGAFRFTKKSKQELLWESYRILGNKKKASINRSLFQEGGREFQIPNLDELQYEDAFDQMELFGFSLCSPFDLLANIPNGIVSANEIMNHLGKNIRVLGYLVTVKNTKTTDGKLMQFGTFVDRFGDWIDTVHFPPVVGRFPFRGKGCYLLVGKVVEEFGYATIEVCEMTKLDYVLRDDNKVVIKRRLKS